MEVIPGKSIGPFVLGMSIASIISIIKENNKIISHVDLKYLEQVFFIY